jgi:HSP20 family molecular chaperone IbpA
MSDETQVTKKEQQEVTPERMESSVTFSPQVDIIEREDCVVVLADMPGVAREDVDIVLEEGTLTINGYVSGSQDTDLKLRRQEYEVGDFHRCFAVGEGFDADNVEASMNSGVLRLTIPKSARNRPRQIEVKSE